MLVNEQYFEKIHSITKFWFNNDHHYIRKLSEEECELYSIGDRNEKDELCIGFKEVTRHHIPTKQSRTFSYLMSTAERI